MKPASTAPFLPAHWQRLILVLTILVLTALLGACGFHLKGTSPLPFNTIYTNISENTSFGAHLRRSIVASSPHTRFVNDPKQAQVKLIQLALDQSKREVSLSPSGQVEEYELKMTFSFELLNARGLAVLEPTTLVRVSEIPYDPAAFQAKQSEISSLFIGMQQGLVDQIVRRLSSNAVHERYQQLENAPDDWFDDRSSTDTPLPADTFDYDNFESPLLNFP